MYIKLAIFCCSFKSSSHLDFSKIHSFRVILAHWCECGFYRAGLKPRQALTHVRLVQKSQSVWVCVFSVTFMPPSRSGRHQNSSSLHFHHGKFRSARGWTHFLYMKKLSQILFCWWQSLPLKFLRKKRVSPKMIRQNWNIPWWSAAYPTNIWCNCLLFQMWRIGNAKTFEIFILKIKVETLLGFPKCHHTILNCLFCCLQYFFCRPALGAQLWQ